MIRKISTQDVVSKRAAENDRGRRERDYLIERLTRKHAAPSVVASPIKTKKRQSKNNFIRSKLFWLSLPIILALFVFIVLQFMFSATISVKPKQVEKQIDTKLVASFNATTSPDALTYQIITLSATDSEVVEITGIVKTKPQKASGQITIFNNFSNTPQTLIANTRFETTDGLVYRIQNPVKIPGFTTSDGKKVPGSITVTVTADQTGSKYNIGMSDFTIPGFKTDIARYTEIFARSKTNMTDGSDGNSFGVSETVRQNAQANIEARIKESLLRQVQSQKTANSVIFDTASKISFQHLADTEGTDKEHAVIHEQGTISAVAFDKKMLSKVLLGDAMSTVGNNVEVQGIESLHFIAAVSSTSPIWQAKPFSFTLTGPIKATGVVDTDKLMQDILGIPRSDLAKILSNYSTVDKATATVKPFWKNSLPNDASKIKIEIVK